MGAAVPLAFLNTLVGPNPPAVLEWDVLKSPALYTFLSSEQLLRHPSALALASSVCKHTLNTRLLPTLYRKVLEFSEPQLSANLLQLLRAFFEEIWAERIPYTFIYQGGGEAQPREGQDFPFRKQVTCVFHYKEVTKAVQVTIPQGEGFDLRREWERLVGEIARAIEALREHLRTQKDTVLLLTSEGQVVDLPYLITHFPDESAHARLHLYVTTTECDLGGDLSCFLTSLVHWYSSLPTPVNSQAVLKAKHACLCLLTALLSSPLYYSKKPPAGTLEYRRAPVLDILCQLQPEAAAAFLRALLGDVVAAYHWLPVKPSFWSGLLNSLWDTSETEDNTLRHQTGSAAMVLTQLLLASQGALPSSFRRAEFGNGAIGSMYVKLVEHMDDLPSLRLLVLLMRHNRSFRDFFTTSSEQDRYLPSVCHFLFTCPLHPAPPRVCLLLSLLLVLSQDAAFILYLNKDARLGSVPWLTEYQTDNMSLGSLLLLSLLRVFRDNLGSGSGYLHTLCTALLFNLGRNSVELHQVTAQVLLQTLVTLWKRSNRPGSEPSKGKSADVLGLYLDLYGNLLQHTYKHNPWLVYMTLHEAETFEEMRGTGAVVERAEHLIAYFRGRQGEESLASVKEAVKVYTLPGDLQLACLRNVQHFELAAEDSAWELWLLPQVWKQAREERLVRLKVDSLVFPLQDL